MTSLKQRPSRGRRARRSAALALRRRSEFLANVSHELRTPLNSLLILSRMLADNREGNLTPEQVVFASTIHATGKELLSLVEEILDLSRVEAGKMPIDPADVRLDSVQAYLERSFGHVAEEKGLRFEVLTAPDLPEMLYTDADRLQQILKNLLSNAFKFTDRGAVTVTVTRAPRARAAGDALLLAFAVKDTGIGIPEDQQKLIFEAFQQADGTIHRKYGGTGLGLTISREISRLLGGSIQVESAPGRGSTFTLLLPERCAGPEARNPAEPDLAPVIEPAPLSPDASFAGRTVLLAGDDVRSAFAIDGVLESRLMNVLHAESGLEAIRLLEENPGVDLVLMDLMREMDGLTAIRSIRQRPAFRRLPIISLAGGATNVDRHEAIEAGASDLVATPIDPERLLAVVHGWLAGPRDDPGDDRPAASDQVA
jgi:CheY-like chemotaxis protein